MQEMCQVFYGKQGMAKTGDIAKNTEKPMVFDDFSWLEHLWLDQFFIKKCLWNYQKPNTISEPFLTPKNHPKLVQNCRKINLKLRKKQFKIGKTFKNSFLSLSVSLSLTKKKKRGKLCRKKTKQKKRLSK